MFVSAQGSHKLWVEVAGPKGAEAVLLIHGFPDSSRLWAEQVYALSSAGYRVLAPDMLGYGRSDKPQEEGAYSLSSIVAGLAELLDQLGVQRAHVVGHDWGASVAWRMAMTVPERVQSLTVLSVGHPGAGTAAGGARQRARWWYFLFFQYRGVAERCLMQDDWALFREFLGSNADAKVTQAYVDALSQPGALTAGLNWYRANFHPELFGQTQLRQMPRVTDCPVLGVWSTGDTALMEDQMRASERYVAPGLWRYERLQAGHWIPRDAPQQLNALLLSFLSSEAQKSRSRL